METGNLFSSLRVGARQAELFKALFTFTSQGIIVFDTLGSIIMLNPKATELFGYGEADLKHLRIESLLPGCFTGMQLQEQWHCSVQTNPSEAQNHKYLYGKRRDSSEFLAETITICFKTNGGQHMAAFIVNITGGKLQNNALLEADLQMQTEVVKALNKEKELNHMKSRFIATASHQFRTPLATILSSTSLISKYTDTLDDGKRQKHIQRIKSSVNYLTEILDDFLSLGKLEEGKVHNNPTHFDLTSFCGGFLEEARQMCGLKQTIEFEFSGVTYVWLDKKLLRTVLFNLVSNAIKYSVENPISVKFKSNDQQVHIHIQDHGTGIAQADLPHIFDRFFRGANATAIDGTGLGLSIVKRCLELMGGDISFSSALGKGTTFDILLVNNVPSTARAQHALMTQLKVANS